MIMEKITSRRNPLCMYIKKLGENRGYRYESNRFLCDGLKLLEEAVSGSAEVCEVIAAKPIPFPLPLDTRVYYADTALLNNLSPLTNAQDVLFTCKIPLKTELVIGKGTYILLDGVQDPGNVGTIIRTACAFGIKGVIMTGACADPYNPKSVRASMGAIFRQSIYKAGTGELTALRDNGARFVRAEPGDAPPLSREMVKNAIIAIGSEGRGLSDGVRELCAEGFTIPIDPQCESLNAAVAAAIIMWESQTRKRR